MTISAISTLGQHTLLPTAVVSWHERVISKLDSAKAQLEVAMPSWSLQSKYDHLVHFIEEKLAPLNAINAWIDDNGSGSIADKLATGLGKLPLRVARNIILSVFKLIHAILDTLIHPIQSLVNLAKFLVDLLYALTQPQTWAKLGAGLTGATLGQAWVLATPVGAIATLIGAALVIAGISVEAILAAYYSEAGHRLAAAKDAALSVMSKVPESFATGLVIGVITGAIRKAKQEADPQYQEMIKRAKQLAQWKNDPKLQSLHSFAPIRIYDENGFEYDEYSLWKQVYEYSLLPGDC